MLLGNDLLELIGTLDDSGTMPGTEDADDPEDVASSAEVTAPLAR